MTLAVPFPSGWRPAHESSLQWWLDASDLTTITRDGADLVAAWSNKKTGTHGNMAQGSASLKPQWLSTGLNGRPCLEFISDAMLGTFAHTNNAMLLLGVGTLINGGITNGNIVAFAQTGFTSGTDTGWVPWKREVLTEAVNSNYSGNFYGSVAVTYTVPYLFTATRLNGTGLMGQLDTYLNGVVSIDHEFGVVTADYDVCALGANILDTGLHGSARPHFRVAELMVFGLSALDTRLRQRAEGYLAHRWGISLDTAHPWRQKAP